ncbi:MAG: glycosyltransferase family 2 protein [Deltaproteobacteria bacterium]
MSGIRATIAIPVLNEAPWIRRTLEAVLAQEFADRTYEILVVDGGSDDGTLAIVQGMQAKDRRIRLLANPQKFQSPALNLAMREARGTFFLRVDARTTIACDYLAACVRLLEEGRAENVGGRMVAVGENPMSRAIALATSTPFGLGNSHFHYATDERLVDTVYLGAWRRKTLLDIGGFDEDAHANEDYELNIRLREAGGRILLSPAVHSTYLPRPDWQGLHRQYTRYGRWKAWTLWKHPSSLRIRQAVPPAFVLALGLAALLNLILPAAGMVLGLLVGTYATAIIAFALITAWPRDLAHFGRLLLIFPTLHLCWGCGLWSELVRLTTRPKNRPTRCEQCKP